MKHRVPLFFPLFIALSLFSCTKPNDKPTFQMEVSYVENGGVVDATADFIYEQVVTLQTNFIFMISVSECAVCTQARADVANYAQYKHLNVYYIELDGLSDDDYTTLRLVTLEYGEKAKALPALISESTTIALPMLYLFYQGQGLAFAQESFTVTIARYVKVAPDSD
ncbi:MAG: hypothetical protein ACOX3K_04185 [Bacilli bacterium]|jgi:hypothetical protein